MMLRPRGTLDFLTLILLVLPAASHAQTELLTNGTFQQGIVGWTVSGAFHAGPDFPTCRSCPGYAYVSNSDGTAGNNLLGIMFQNVSIPAGATSATLSFWYNITSQETGSTPFDVLNVTIKNTSGTSTLASVTTLSNLHKGTLGSYSQIVFNMSAFVGQTVRLDFVATTDASLPTTFRIDDVSLTAVTAAPPHAPTNLSAAAISSNWVSLAWTDNANNETGFKIERKIGAGGVYGQIGTQSMNLNFFNDQTVSAGTQYCYRVRATNGTGDSGYSNESCTTTPGVPPAAPTNLSAAAISSNWVSLAWTDNANNETGFKIERKIGTGGAFSQIGTQSTNLNFFNDQTVSAGTQYCYRVRSTNGAGDSAYSNEACASTPGVAPTAPTNLSAVASSPALIILTWTDNANNETGFKIERKTTVGGTYGPLDTQNADVSFYEDDSVSPNTQYCYRVRATNGGGDSAYSNESCATTPDVEPACPGLKEVRVSVKFVLDPMGNRPPSGWYDTNGEIHAAIDEANQALANLGADWRLRLVEILDVPGISQWYGPLDCTLTNKWTMEAQAEASPSAYQWRSDAVNVYMISKLNGCGGICSFPNTPDDIILVNVLEGVNNNGIGWLHEVGHYFNLTHTFLPGPAPTDCTIYEPAKCLGGENGCIDICPDRFNVMSYYCDITPANADLSSCQSDFMASEMDMATGRRRAVMGCLTTPPSPTATPTASPSSTPTHTPTPTPTRTFRASPTATPTGTPTPTSTRTFTLSSTSTPTGTPTAASTPTFTGTSTPTFTTSPTQTPTATSTQTQTTTPSATPTPTATQAPTSVRVSGEIVYYRGGVAVEGASVRGNGPMSSMTATDANGVYSLDASFLSSWWIEPSKEAGWGGAVSSLDAAWVLQNAVGLRQFDSYQLLACDVTGNGTVSSLDAARILQFSVGLLARFPVAVSCTSDWAFSPSPLPAPNQSLIVPATAGQFCQNGAISFDPITTTAEGQNFYAILFGDCTGNWHP